MTMPPVVFMLVDERTCRPYFAYAHHLRMVRRCRAVDLRNGDSVEWWSQRKLLPDRRFGQRHHRRSRR